MRSCRGGIGGEPELCVVADCPNPVGRWVLVRPDLEAGYCHHHDDTDTAEPDEVAAQALETDEHQFEATGDELVGPRRSGDPRPAA